MSLTKALNPGTRPSPISTYCRFFAKPNAQTDSYRDFSGNGNHASLNGTANLTATPGQLTTATGGNIAQIPRAAFGTYGTDYDTLILTVRASVTPAGATNGFICLGTSTSKPGFLVRVNSDGKARWALYHAGGQQGFGETTSVVFDGTAHDYLIAMDSDGTTWWYTDGVADATHGTGGYSQSVPAWTDDNTDPVSIGGYTTASSLATVTRYLGIYAWLGGLPSGIDIAALAARARAYPHRPFTPQELGA